MPKSGYNYAWERSGNKSLPLQRMEGVHSPQMTIKNLTPEDSGSYRCIVSNHTGTIESEYENVTAKGIYYLFSQ